MDDVFVTANPSVIDLSTLGVDMMNLSAREYLELMRGPQHISHEIVIPITVVYVIIFVTGVIGNVIVCLVIARNAQFQTPTNYYLFSLAISDLLILMFGLPNDLKVYWQQYPWIFGETVCKLRALIAEMTSYASVLTIVAFSTERYLAICHPLLIQTVSSLSRATKIIATVWIVAGLCAIPFAVYTKVNYLEYPNGTGLYLQESAFCSLPLENNDVSLPLVQFSSFVFFCLPMTLIVVIYVKIGLKLRRSRFSILSFKQDTFCCCGKSNEDSTKNWTMDSGSSKGQVGRVNSSSVGSSGDHKQRQPTRRSVNKMLVAVVIAFFLCWAPFHTQRLFACFFDFSEWTRQLRQLNEILYYTGGCLYYFSATINPILYSLISVKYREAFRDTLCSFNGKRDMDHIASRYSYRPSESMAQPDQLKSNTAANRRVSLLLEVSNGNCLQAEPEKLTSRNTSDRKPVRHTLSQLIDRLRFRKPIRKNSQSIDEQKQILPVIKVTGATPEKCAASPVTQRGDETKNEPETLLQAKSHKRTKRNNTINTCIKNPAQNITLLSFKETTV